MDNESEIFENTLKSFPNHCHLLRRAVNRFKSDGRVAGLLLGGSLANEDLSVDRYSDIDLYIIISEDLDVVLDDTVGFLTELVAESQDRSLEEPSAERLRQLDQKFWTWCWDVFGFIERGELWTAIASIHSIRSTFLLPLLAWETETPAYGYRRLESKMSERFANRLESTLAQRTPEDLYTALQGEIELYDELRDDVFSRYDVPYDQEAETVVREEIRRDPDEGR